MCILSEVYNITCVRNLSRKEKINLNLIEHLSTPTDLWEIEVTNKLYK